MVERISQGGPARSILLVTGMFLTGRKLACETGKVDSRQSTFRKLYPLGACSYHGCHHWIQIFASISFAATRAPEDHGRSVICQVPCYSGGDTLLCSNIDSLAQGEVWMVSGSRNDRPSTPRIVLDIPGADSYLDSGPLSSVSLWRRYQTAQYYTLWIVQMRWPRCTIN